MCFAVMEVCGGWGGITMHCQRRGLCTGPVIELKKGWDLFAPGFPLVITLDTGRPDLVLVPGAALHHFLDRSEPEPRSKLLPEGFEPCEFETLQGNLFGVMCGILAIAQ